MDDRPRIVVYTAVLGGYDELRPPIGTNRMDARFVCFTDARVAAHTGWQMEYVDGSASVDARVRYARFIKAHPHTLLGAHEISIWVDANLELVADPAELAAFVDTRDIATFAYPSTYGLRDCIYQEAQACVERGKDDPVLIFEQMARFVSEGYPVHNGLVETSIVVRRNSTGIVVFNEGWWREIKNGSRRDQLSFNYVAHQQRVSYATLPGSRICSAFARYRPHAVSIYPS